jgi:hypothetical protein
MRTMDSALQRAAGPGVITGRLGLREGDQQVALRADKEQDALTRV